MADQQKVNVHELAALPYGAAKDALRKAGLWDEYGGEDENEEPPGPVRSFKVRVHGTIAVSATVTVEARSEDEAEDLAAKKAEDGLSSDWFYGRTEIDFTEVTP